MKRLLVAFICSALLLTGCTVKGENADKRSGDTAENIQEGVTDVTSPNIDVEFVDLEDPELLQYVEDSVLATTEEELSSDDYVIESVVASYVSKEYLEELNYNSQENIYFGYKLSDIEAQFEGARYVFALDDNGETGVKSFEAYDDTFDQVLKNVAIGSGVILVCVTVSIVAGTVAAPAATAVSTVFAASAATGTSFALTSGALGAIAGGAITGIQTGDVDAALKAAALAGSDGFKWGAITGVIAGGATKALELQRISKAAGTATASKIPTYAQSEIDAHKAYGGVRERSYLGKKIVDRFTPGATRPDLTRTHNGRLEAIEVKNYDLSANYGSMKRELTRQVTQRKFDLPSSTRQRVLLDTRGRGYSSELIEDIRKGLLAELKQIDPSVVIDIWR